jgi:hypothetical protein
VAGPPDTPSTIEQAATQEDTADGAHRGQRLDPTFLECAADGSGSVFAQGAGLLELLAEVDDQVLDPRRGCCGRSPATAGSIGPIDAVEALVVGPTHPDLDGAQADVELLGHRTQRPALTYRSHQGPASWFLAVFRS